ncbi:MAG: GNAT family protein [Pseudomonadota bacterium]
MPRLNEHGQPVGDLLTDIGPRPRPTVQTLGGRWATLRRTNVSDAADLHAAFALDDAGALWTYLSRDRPETVADFEHFLNATCGTEDPYFFTVFDSTDQAVGFLSYLRIAPKDASIEVGWVGMSPRMRRSVLSTDALFLMMRHAFDDLGYRRIEWKCDALNAPSRAAATRLGFTFEGLFRQATHYKGRNRDTAWFSILDTEWPAQKARFKTYLDPHNFDDAGVQIVRLQEC